MPRLTIASPKRSPQLLDGALAALFAHDLAIGEIRPVIGECGIDEIGGADPDQAKRRCRRTPPSSICRAAA